MPTTKSELLYEQLLAMSSLLPNEKRYTYQLQLQQLVAALKAETHKKNKIKWEG